LAIGLAHELRDGGDFRQSRERVLLHLEDFGSTLRALTVAQPILVVVIRMLRERDTCAERSEKRNRCFRE
jgi:hypothetical protein